MQLQNTVRGALAAAALVTLVAAPAHAAIVVYSGPPISITPNIDGLYLNVVTGASANGSVAGWDINIYNNSTLSPTLSFWAATGGGYVGVGSAVSNLTTGTPIGPASNFLSTNVGGGFTATDFAGTTGLFGFRFINEAAGTTHYGWARMSSGTDGGFPASIVSYAFESTPNLGVQAGIVPEPGTYALMLAGLAGVAGFAARSRRKAA